MTSDQFTSLLRSALKIGGAVAVSRGLASDSDAQAVIGGVLALCGIVLSHWHHAGDDTNPAGPGPALFAILLAAGLVVSGCAHVSSRTTKTTDPKTGVTTEETKVIAYSLWDSENELSKLRNSTGGTNGSGTYIGALNQASTSTNLNQLIGVVVDAAVKAAVKP